MRGGKFRVVVPAELKPFLSCSHCREVEAYFNKLTSQQKPFYRRSISRSSEYDSCSVRRYAANKHDAETSVILKWRSLRYSDLNVNPVWGCARAKLEKLQCLLYNSPVNNTTYHKHRNNTVLTRLKQCSNLNIMITVVNSVCWQECDSHPYIKHFTKYTWIVKLKKKSKSRAIPVTGRGGLLSRQSAHS
jgi:hypothetical protein